jgi:hypothetical protein
MIRYRDATTLALTKLRTRKVRLIVTIVISGLLFSGLAGASIVARGIMGSIDSFGKEGLGDRYIAQANTQSSYDFSTNQTIIDRALAIHKDIVARKKVEAKRLDLPYDASTETSPVAEYDTPAGKQRYLAPGHPAADQALAEYLAAHPTAGEPELRQLADKYHPKDFYQAWLLPYDLQGGQLQVLKDGKEKFDSQLGNKGYFSSSGTDSFTSFWQAMSPDLLRPFILPGENLQAGADGSIPIIAPYSAVEQILKLKSLPKSASAEQRLARAKEVREKAKGVTFNVCYRNNTSSQMVSEAIATQQELEQNKNKKDYRKPDFIRGLPKEACGQTTVDRDVRSKEQKTLEEKQTQFNQIFGEQPPKQEILTFRLVGMVPDADYSSAFGVSEIIRSLVTSTLGNGWYTPLDLTLENPTTKQLFEGGSPTMKSPPSFYVEFSTANDARNFIDKEGCTPDFGNVQAGQDPFAQCLKDGKPFSTGPYGSNSLALESAKKTFGKIFRIAALIVAAIAAIIMMGTVGRMIADSRRETAVFRAIGAKKMDIAQIYLVYTTMLSLLISLFALIFGTILALIAHNRWADGATVEAILAYNAQDLGKSFNLYAFHWPDILMLIGLALAAGIISAVFPLIRNLRRNPIRDMRDDT